MKLILIFTILLFNSILADTLPNTGLKQNQYGYYGEGVTFGGLPIVGEWILPSYSSGITTLDNNGTIPEKKTKWGNIYYGVNENASELQIGCEKKFRIINSGNNGCFYTEFLFSSCDFQVEFAYDEIICKTQINNKTYGINSNHVSVTVGSGE